MRRSSLMIVSLALGAVSAAALAQSAVGVIPQSTPGKSFPAVPLDPDYGMGEQDPPGVLAKDRLASLKKLATRLSSSRNWLTREVLQGLSRQEVYLDEVFSEAPSFIEVDGRLYRVALEKVGPAWQNFNPRTSPFLIFLNHEAYDGLGENYALSFQSGKERVIVREDVEQTAALGLTLRDVPPGDVVKDRRKVVGVDAPIRLGKVRPQLRSPKDAEIQAALGRLESATAKSTCQQEAAPSACLSGVPTCSSSNATSYFVLTSIMIKKDLEDDIFQGNPEVELFPLRVSANTPSGGWDARTQWIFSGRTVIDKAGRSRYLPDVNNENTWYNVSGGLALFPSNGSSEWVGTLIEDDDETGRLKIDRDKLNPVKPPRQVTVQFWPFDYFQILKDNAGVILDAILGLFDNSDDLFVQSLQVDNQLFCETGLGQPFPNVYHLTGSDWEMRGYFGCVDPTCAPPPPVYEPPTDPCGGGGTGGGFSNEYSYLPMPCN